MIIVQDFFMITPPSNPNPNEGITFGQLQDFSGQETVVVPPTPTPEATAPVVEVSPDMQVPLPTIPEKEQGGRRSNPWPKRIILFLLLIILIIGGLFGGRYIIDMMNASKEVTISYWGLWEDESIIQPVIAAFEAKNPKIKVQYSKQSHKQYRERLQAAISRGEGPDVFRFHNTWVPMMRNDLSLVPEGVMTTNEFDNIFYPVASNDLVAGNAIYGIPVMFDGLGLYYNEDLFATAGITAPPSTWEELLTMVPKIAKPDGETFTISAIALGTTGNVEHYSDILSTMFMQNGIGNGIPQGTTAQEALMFYRKFATPNDPVYTWNDTMDNSIYAFAIGKVAMIMAPSWRAFDIQSINPNLRFKIAPIPQLPGSSVNWASYWVEGVSSQSKYQQQAWEFVKFLTSKEGATLLYSEAQRSRKLFGEPYARKELAAMLEDDPYVGAYIKQAPTAQSFPLASRTFDNGLNDRLIVYLQNAVNAIKDGSSPESEMETMVAGFQQVFSTYGLVSNTAPAASGQQ